MIRIRRTNQNKTCMQTYPKSKSSLIRSAAHTLLSARVLHAPVWLNGSSPRGIGWQIQLCWMASSSFSSNTTFNMHSTNHCTTFTCWMPDSTIYCT